MQPGVKTSEFWVAFGTAIVTIVVSIAALLGHDLSGTQTSLQPLISVGGLFGAALASAAYSTSRGKVKAAAVTAGAVVSTVGSAHDDAISGTVVPVSTDPVPEVVQPGKQPGPEA